jgi:hypothetical protein
MNIRTHKGLARALLASACCLASGCATTTLESRPFKSYNVGVTTRATIGDPFLVAQNGTVEKIRTWVGILNSPNGWKTEDRYSVDFVRKELIYAGKSGSTIDISYREFRGGLAAPAFFQNLKYDLAESSLVRFQRFQIQIDDASNQSITYQILSD